MVRVPRHSTSVAGIAIFFAGSALAEPIPSVDLRGFRPPTHPEGLTTLEPTAPPPQGEWNIGAFFSYAYRPVVVKDSFQNDEVAVVQNQLSLDLVASMGVAERLSVGLSVPAVLYQQGEPPPPSLGTSALPKAAFGDFGFDARATLLPQGEIGGFGLAIQALVSLPSGNPASYISDGSTRTELRLLGELGVLGLSLRAAAGARIRAEAGHFAGETYGHDLPWGLGFVLRPQVFGIDREGRYLVALDAHGAIALTPTFAAAEQSPAALALGVKRGFGDAFLTLGAELPLDGAQGVPIVRAITSIGWAPRTHDEDNDGIDDDEDGCRSLAEDKDGFEDADGCPDFDNDGDGVSDPDDRCPKELEDRDGFQDEDGCPDPDDDADGIPDKADACPRERGVANADAKLNGCVVRDRDGDGVPDPLDRCPGRREDVDGFEDEDGCPDTDDDRDRVPDKLDVCPREPGMARSDPKLNGCPSPDRDGDTFDDAEDRCPAEAETFDGVEDTDGCPEAAPKAPLARFEPAKTAKGPRLLLRTARPITFDTKSGGVKVAPASDSIVRAIAALLNAHPDYVLMVAVRPARATPAAEQEALTKSFAVADALRTLTHRDDLAETIGWAALGRVPGAARPEGIGFLVLSPVPEPPKAVTPAPPATGPAPPATTPAPPVTVVPAPPAAPLPPHREGDVR